MGWLKSMLSRWQQYAEASGPNPPAPGAIRPTANPPAPLARRAGGGVELDPLILEIVELVVEDALSWAQDERRAAVYLNTSTRELAEEYTRIVGRRRMGVVLRRNLHAGPRPAAMKADRMQEG